MQHHGRTQACPLCAGQVREDRRYPRYVCRECLKGGVLVDGTGVSLQQMGRTVLEVSSIKCTVNGIACEAREAHFGGVVVQVIGTVIRAT